MPRYRYACARCGAFDEMRPLEAYAEPCACPECGAMAPRELAVAGIAGRGVVQRKRQGAVAASSPELRLLRPGRSGRSKGGSRLRRRSQEWVNSAGGLIFDSRLT
jgi:putative FmdB family regulatory protein